MEWKELRMQGAYDAFFMFWFAKKNRWDIQEIYKQRRWHISPHIFLVGRVEKVSRL